MKNRSPNKIMQINAFRVTDEGNSKKLRQINKLQKSLKPSCKKHPGIYCDSCDLEIAACMCGSDLKTSFDEEVSDIDELFEKIMENDCDERILSDENGTEEKASDNLCANKMEHSFFSKKELKKAWKTRKTDNAVAYQEVLSRPNMTPFIFGSSTAIELLDTVAKQYPNFEALISIIKSQVAMNMLAKRPIKLPKLNLHGEPGIGKTDVIRKIATALGLEFFDLSIGNIHQRFELVGGHMSYNNATIGEIGRLVLMQATTANPIILLDELCEVRCNDNENIYHPLYALLDNKQSGIWRESYLGIDLNLRPVNFIATSNRLKTIPGAIISRLKTVFCERPNSQQILSILERMYGELIDSEGLSHCFESNVPPQVISMFTDLTPREANTQLEIAIGNACLRYKGIPLTLSMADINKGETSQSKPDVSIH